LNQQNVRLNEKSQWSQIAAELQDSGHEFQIEQKQLDEKKKQCSKRLKQTHLNTESIQNYNDKNNSQDIRVNYEKGSCRSFYFYFFFK
jgi:hypothetical protein